MGKTVTKEHLGKLFLEILALELGILRVRVGFGKMNGSSKLLESTILVIGRTMDS